MIKVEYDITFYNEKYHIIFEYDEYEACRHNQTIAIYNIFYKDKILYKSNIILDIHKHRRILITDTTLEHEMVICAEFELYYINPTLAKKFKFTKHYTELDWKSLKYIR